MRGIIRRKTILFRTLNLFVIGSLAFIGIHFLGKSSNQDAITTSNSPGATGDYQAQKERKLEQVMSSNQEIDVQGKIVKIRQANQAQEQAGTRVLGVIMVDGLSRGGREIEASVTIKETTLILGRTSEAEAKKGFTDLNIGQLVEVNFEGPVMQSHPIRAIAERVIIIY